MQIKINVPGKIKEIWERMDENRFNTLLIGQKALLDKMAMSNDADILNRAVLKRAKKWRVAVGLSIIDADVEVDGTVLFNSSIYDPEFDVTVTITKKQLLGFRKHPYGKVRVKGKLPDLEFEILERSKQARPKDIDLKKYAVFALIPAINYAIFKPIALEVLSRGVRA